MSDALPSIALVAAAYLIGSIPSAYLIGRLIAGIDIREYGSGNVGASNVSVHVGKKWVAPIAIFDVFVKGFPTCLRWWLSSVGPRVNRASDRRVGGNVRTQLAHIPKILRRTRNFSRPRLDGRLWHAALHPVGNDPRGSLLTYTLAGFGGILALSDNLVTGLGDMGWLWELGSRIWCWIRAYHDCPASYIRRIQRFVVNLWGVDTCQTCMEPHGL